MSIREDLINAKIDGKLHKVACEKLAQCVKDFKDLSAGIDIIEEIEKNAEKPVQKLLAQPMRNLLLGLAGLTFAGGAVKSGIEGMKIKKNHKEVLSALENDPSYPDKKKLESIYSMVSQFAPKAVSNPMFAKSIMDQLYNSPMITAPMVKDIVDIEDKMSRSGAKGGFMGHVKSVADLGAPMTNLMPEFYTAE